MNQDAVTPARGYLICCIERTGSNLLAEALQRTGVAGWPREYFNPVSQDTPLMREILGESTMVTGFLKILRAGTTPNGVFGAKVHWGHLRCFADALSPNSEGAVSRSRFTAAYRLFESELPDLRIIWLRRRNMVGRAISLYRAQRSKVWVRSVKNGDATEPVPDFDFAQIHKLYGTGLFQEQSWQRLFGEVNVTPYCVTYEELAGDYEQTVRGVLRFLGIDDAVKTVAPPQLVRQADAVSAEWEVRYRALSAGGR